MLKRECLKIVSYLEFCSNKKVDDENYLHLIVSTELKYLIKMNET